MMLFIDIDDNETMNDHVLTPHEQHRRELGYHLIN